MDRRWEETRKLISNSLAQETRIAIGANWISRFVDRFKFSWKVVIAEDTASAKVFAASSSMINDALYGHIGPYRRQATVCPVNNPCLDHIAVTFHRSAGNMPCYIDPVGSGDLLHHVTDRAEHGGVLWRDMEAENMLDCSSKMLESPHTFLLHR